MTEPTLAIIKPDAVQRHLAGRIIQRIEDEGFQIRGMRCLHLSKAQAEGIALAPPNRAPYGDMS